MTKYLMNDHLMIQKNVNGGKIHYNFQIKAFLFKLLMVKMRGIANVVAGTTELQYILGFYICLKFSII